MILYAIGFLGCAALLLVASRLVLHSLTQLAHILRLPIFIVALVLVAMSTSIPELFVGISAALDGVPSYSLGDIFGSNIVNLTFIAGIVILLGRKDIALPDYISTRLLLSTFVIASVPTLLILDGTLSRFDGAILIGIYILYVYFTIADHKDGILEPPPAVPGFLRAFVPFVFGIALLIGSAEGIVHIAASISESLHIVPFVIGVFAIALSTSLPELALGLRAAYQKTPEVSLADLLGASVVNASGILGIVALIHPIEPVSIGGVLFTGFFGIFVFLVFFLLVGKGTVRPVRGVLLLILYLIFASLNLLV